MPWKRTSPMGRKTQVIADYLKRRGSISELCTNYCISRKTGCRWIDRYLHEGPGGLEDRSRAPCTAPNRTPVVNVKAIMGEISTASREQLSGIEQVGHAVIQMDRMTQENSALVGESAATAQNMAEQAGQLVEAVSRFRLGASVQAKAAPANQATLVAPPASPTMASHLALPTSHSLLTA